MPISKKIVFFFAILVLFLKISDKNFGKNGNYGVIDWDNFGYYLYLPATFIYHDLKLQDDDQILHVLEKYSLSSSYYQAHKIPNGNRVIQYTSGMSLFYAPAFIVGHTVASFSSSFKADGFSLPYQISILIECFIFLFLGLLYLRKLFLTIFSEGITVALLVCMLFGTNLLQLSSVNISSPHVIIFVCYSILLVYIISWHNQPNLKSLIVISFLSAFVALTRPNELLFLIIPVLWRSGKIDTFKKKINFFRQNPTHLLLAILPFGIGAIQPIYWHYVSDEWIFDTYINEDFKLLDPYLSEYLFSFKKGWLIYTPIMGFSLIGFYSMYKSNSKLFYPLILFCLLNIWILSSWDCWWYAGSFSQRSIVQAYPIFALPLGFLIKGVWRHKKSLKVFISSIIGLCILLNLFQTYQARAGILHSSRMTKEYYFSSFFDVKLNEKKQILLDPHRELRYIPNEQDLVKKLIYKNSFNSKEGADFNFNDTSYREEGKLTLSKESPYSPSFKFAFNDFCDSSYAYFFARIRYKSNYAAKENPFGIVASTIDHKSGKVYKYNYRGVEDIDWFKEGEWQSMDILYIPPYLRSLRDSLVFFVINNGNQNVEVDQFYVEMLDPTKRNRSNHIQFFNDYHTITIGNWSKGNVFNSELLYERIDSLNPYSSTLTIDSAEQYKGFQLEFRFKGLLSQSNNEDCFAVISIIDSDNQSVFYKSKHCKLTSNWEEDTLEVTLPSNLPKESKLKVYLWSRKEAYFIKWSEVVLKNKSSN